ncbi:MAG: hypothetical protein KAQ98_08555 [Bacteriovoracaceae bacterium]|nr:hypothetical protein [Bacteriovoracaceae bacterium]
MSKHPLGKWALIDIETTGVDPACDKIIDVGFLQFEGTKLVGKFSSLVQFDGELSHFIQRLTGITNKMVHNAPPWSQVKNDVLDLMGYHLIAHNAAFEESFLKEHFDYIDDGSDEREIYDDSLFFLSLMCPGKSTLNLESFITQWGIRDSEKHRGFEDSLDLLKVMLTAVGLVKSDSVFANTLSSLLVKYRIFADNYWFAAFFNLSDDELELIASQIDFDLKGRVEAILESRHEVVTGLENITEHFKTDFSGENIRNILRDEPRLREIFPGYMFRESQEILAFKTGQSFKNNIHSMIQAPTGTGKTLGYLLPSILFAMNEGKQVLISTGTKTLQNQIMAKDVGQIRAMLGLPDSKIKIRRLIGSGNHFCELLFRNEQEEKVVPPLEMNFEEQFIDLYFELIFFHNARESSDKTIHRDDFPHIFKRKFSYARSRESAWAVDFRSCAGRSCPFSSDCSYQRGLREAKDASIIVGNHALMFSWPRGFPRPMHVIVDEAHKIEGEVTRSFTHETTKEGLQGLHSNLVHLHGIGSMFYLLAAYEENEGEATRIINDIREQVLSSAQILGDHLKELPDLVECFFKKLPRYTDIYWNEARMFMSDTSGLAKSIRNHLESIRNVVGDCLEVLIPYLSRWEMKDLDDENEIVALSRFEKFMGILEDTKLALDHVLDCPKDFVGSIRFHETYGYEFLSAPINVGRVLHDGLLEVSSSVVFTSATLGNASGDRGTKGIEWATGYLYLPPEKRFNKGYFLPAVYDYEQKTKVYFSDDTLPLYNPSFVKTTLKPVIKLVREIEGRSLFLFSARARFEIAREVLLDEFEGEIPLFIQGMGTQVVEEFKKSSGGILLGMESFGEGIDVPGDTLQFIFIDKIPDMRQDLVINERRDFFEREIGNEFTDYYLAHRTRSLHQKLGRLLRTENDFGGVIVVDSRLKKWKGATMQKVMRLMKPYQIIRAPLEEACQGIKEFILEKHPTR